MKLESLNWMAKGDGIACMTKGELRELLAENESLRVDAGRYRWLRAGGESSEKIYIKDALSAGRDCGADTYDPYFEVVKGEELDKAIDAAINSPENHS